MKRRSFLMSFFAVLTPLIPFGRFFIDRDDSIVWNGGHMQTLPFDLEKPATIYIVFKRPAR